MYKKIFTKLLLFILFIVLIFSQMVSATIKVEPSRLIFTIDPGQRTTDVIKVINNTDETVELTAVYYDWDLDQKDEMLNYESGTLLESFDGLIRFNPRNLKLGPGEDQFVRFTISIPAEASGEHERRGIIFFEHVAPYEGEGMGANVRTMIGTTVYALPSSYEIDFNLRGIVHQDEKNNYWGVLLAKNNSKVHLRYIIEYTIADSQGFAVEEGSLDSKVLLPDNERGLYFPIEKDLEPGNYEMILNVDFIGTDEQMSTSIPFEIE